MRLSTSSSSLFALSSLFLLSSSLPFEPRNVVRVEPLVRRATYSVVAVDGGFAAASTGSPPQATTIIETIVQIQTQSHPDTTRTVLVTVTPSPATVTATDYSIVDVYSPVTVEVLESDNTQSSSSSSTVSSTKLCSSSPISSTTSSIRTAPSSESAGSSSSSYTSTFISSTGSSTLSSTSYDNGQWHTLYPSWSNSTRTRAPSPPLPTLKPSSPFDLLADSVPGMEP